MANIFERIRQGFKNMTAPTVAASERGDEAKTAAGRVTKNILTDLSISLGNTEGLSDEALADYERRTEISKQAMADLQAQNQRDSGSSSPPPASTRPAISVQSTAAAPPQMKMDDDAPGSAEEDVEATLRKKGRRSTIQTTSQGLLSSAPTRRRRSLMGGGLIS